MSSRNIKFMVIDKTGNNSILKLQNIAKILLNDLHSERAILIFMDWKNPCCYNGYLICILNTFPIKNLSKLFSVEIDKLMQFICKCEVILKNAILKWRTKLEWMYSIQCQDFLDHLTNQDSVFRPENLSNKKESRNWPPYTHSIDSQQRLQDNSVEETKVYLSRGVWTIEKQLCKTLTSSPLHTIR